MNSSFWYSLLGHVLIGLLLLVSLPTFQKKQTLLDSAPIFIDLKNIEISDKTNLPPKIESRRKDNLPVVKPVIKKEPVKVETKVKEIKPEPEKIEPVQKAEPVKEAAQVVEKAPEKKPDPLPKIKPKVPKRPPVKPKPVPAKAKPKEDDELDSLFASVEKMAKTDNTKSKKKKDDVSDLISGVLNGVEKGPTQVPIGEKLTVSEIDFISAEVRKHWNFDAGIEGIETMIVEVRVSLTREGQVEDVVFLNKKRFDQDASFRSVAESAKRAILMCDRMGTESPFKILALKYPERYSVWKSLVLSFNPLDKGI